MNLLERRRIIMSGLEKTFNPLENLTARVYVNFNGYYMTDIKLDSGDKIKLKFATFSTNSMCIVGSRELQNADTDSNLIELDATGLNYRAMKYKFEGNYYYSQQAVSTNQRYVVEADVNGATIDPALGTTMTGANYTYNTSRNLAILGMALQNGNVFNKFSGDFFGLEIYGGDGTLKHRLIPQSDLSLLDEVTLQSYQITGSGTYADD